MALKDSLSRALVCTTVTFMKIVQVQPIPCTDQISAGQQSVIIQGALLSSLKQSSPWHLLIKEKLPL